jgi:hypothetical protein
LLLFVAAATTFQRAHRHGISKWKLVVYTLAYPWCGLGNTLSLMLMMIPPHASHVVSLCDSRILRAQQSCAGNWTQREKQQSVEVAPDTQWNRHLRFAVDKLVCRVYPIVPFQDINGCAIRNQSPILTALQIQNNGIPTKR